MDFQKPASVQLVMAMCILALCKQAMGMFGRYQRSLPPVLLLLLAMYWHLWMEKTPFSTLENCLLHPFSLENMTSAKVSDLFGFQLVTNSIDSRIKKYYKFFKQFYFMKHFWHSFCQKVCFGTIRYTAFPNLKSINAFTTLKVVIQLILTINK